MAKAKKSKSEEVTPELVESLRPYAKECEMLELEAALWQKQNLDPVLEKVAKTRAEAGRLLGVDERTISNWQSDPTFPGRPGEAGQANGYYPIEKIKAWRAQNVRPMGTSESEALAKLRQRKLAADTTRREVELQRMTGELIPLSDAQAVIIDAVNSARSRLEAWPSRMVERVPKTKPKLRKWLFKMATSEARDLLRSLEDAISGGDEDDEGDGDGGRPDLLPAKKGRRKKT